MKLVDEARHTSQSGIRVAARAGAAAGTIWSIPLLLVYILPGVDWIQLEGQLVSFFVDHSFDSLTSEAISYLITIVGLGLVILSFTALGATLGILYLRSYNRLAGRDSIRKGVAFGGILWVIAIVVVLALDFLRGFVLLEVAKDGALSFGLAMAFGVLIGVFYYEFTRAGETRVGPGASEAKSPLRAEAPEDGSQG